MMFNNTVPALPVIMCAVILSACSNINEPAKSPAANVSYASVLKQAKPDHSIKLHYGAQPLQFGRLYLPATAHAASPVPLLVFIHGGCWLNAYDISHSTAFSQAVSAEGFAVWSVEYRRTGDEGGGWPGSLDDVISALKYAKTSLVGYPVDSKQLVIAGHSAGGQLALLAASPQHNTDIQGVIGLAAITDLVSYAAGSNSCQRATEAYIGGSLQSLPERYTEASPQFMPMHPATLLLHGMNDTIVPVSQATDSGQPYQLVSETGHFDWIHPQTQAFKQFLTRLKELVAP